MIRSLFTAAALAAIPVTLPAAAQEMPASMETVGPVVGDPAPPVNVVTAAGDPANLATLAGENGTAIAFVRSLAWCPYCQKQAIGLEDAKAPLDEAGWSLVALSYDSPETLARFAGKKDITYTLVSDADSEVIRAFNLLNRDVREGSRQWGIPHPAIVFIRKDGTVAAVLREEGYKKRPEVEAVVETAKLLNEAAGS